MSGAPGFDRRLLLLLLLPLGIYALTYLVIDQARPANVSFPHVEFQHYRELPYGIQAAQSKYYYFWLSSYVLLTGVCIAVACGAGMALWREARRHDQALVWLCVGV